MLPAVEEPGRLPLVIGDALEPIEPLAPPPTEPEEPGTPDEPEVEPDEPPEVEVPEEEPLVDPPVDGVPLFTVPEPSFDEPVIGVLPVAPTPRLLTSRRPAALAGIAEKRDMEATSMAAVFLMGIMVRLLPDPPGATRRPAVTH